MKAYPHVLTNSAFQALEARVHNPRSERDANVLLVTTAEQDAARKAFGERGWANLEEDNRPTASTAALGFVVFVLFCAACAGVWTLAKWAIVP